ncbi:hypothetical protein C7441_11073 [Pseudaminobacter salicylatoxidans]|uniref:Uncharacterized protein n=1 Tax=Pseudaminobacter salicylatoxidans TaxID=93369 RepID=A0A316C0N5_PSESE|nr:hypothetical protein [Pseudaminobacter salicylatoxidans]PWJ81541.1 hypothetical protein C7441_11073 [Pseudaminobacter salicylatoxidans]
MRHTRSSAEVEIRDAVVKRFRELWPDARIIHEMNVEHGSSRADVVAVQPDRLWICEIKSKKDKLDRLSGQIADFGPCCHGMIVAAHEKWTKSPGMETMKHGIIRQIQSPLSLALAGTRRCYDIWEYPEPNRESRWRNWSEPYRAEVPWYHRMLMLLWADEIRSVASEHRVSCDRRTPAYKLAPEISRLLSGKEIETAVCKMLRAREFAEADPPMADEDSSAAARPNLYRQESML